MERALSFALYGLENNDEWVLELARRMQMLATYDLTEKCASGDWSIGGESYLGFMIVNVVGPKWVLKMVSWLLEIMGPSRENHIMRSSPVIEWVNFDRG